jgi:hypothetical protein
LCMCINRRGAKLSCRSLFWLYREKKNPQCRKAWS